MSILSDVDKSIIRNYVGQLHVSELDATVADLIARKYPKITQAQLKAAQYEALKAHHANQDLFRKYRF